MSAPPLKGKGSSKGPSFGGSFLQDSVRGVSRVRIWPSPQSKKTREKLADNREKFAQANKLAKYLTAREQLTVREAVKGTVFFPRDWIIAAMYGRAYAISANNGVYYSMAVRSEVSKSLDVLAQTPGEILYRSTEFWVALSIGGQGQVLTVDENGFPSWRDAGAGGSGASGIMPVVKQDDTRQVSTFGNAVKGSRATFSNPLTINSLIAEAALGSNAPTHLICARLVDDGPTGEVAEIVVKQPCLPVNTFISPTFWRADFPAVTLQAGEVYLFASAVEGQGGNYSVNQALGNSAITIPPGTIGGTLTYPVDGLGVGDVVSQIGSNTYWIWPILA